MKIRFCMIAALVMIVLWMQKVPQPENSGGCTLPVLLYHHFDENVTADTVVSPGRFREQMIALKEAGYTTVTLRQIVDYVEQGVPLPDKPILITMDDGYTSNLTIAAPILEELGMCATVFLIGIYEGETINPHSGNVLYPARFAYEAAAEWVEKGVLELQSHTYDMHQKAVDGFSGRDGILRLVGEEDAAYRLALQMDAEAFSEKMKGRGATEEVFALAYPYGFFCSDAREILEEVGIRMTFTVVEHKNTLRVGEKGCLWNMGRFNVTNRDSGAALLQRLGG